MTVWELLERRDAHDPWLRFAPSAGPAVDLTVGEVRDHALAVARRLHADGVEPGQRVALLARNSAEYLFAMFGAARLGAVLVPLNWLLTPRELAYQVADAGAVAMIAEPEGIDRLAEAAAVGELSGLRYSLHGPREGWPSVHDGPPVDLPEPPGPDALFEILYTSGSTSAPKGVMLTNASVAGSAERMQAEWSLGPTDVFLTPLPLFHVNAQLMTTMPSLWSGARMVLQDAFSASGWIGQVRAAGATVVPLVGTQVRMIMATEPRPDDSENVLRFMPYGLNVPEDMWKAFEERFGAPLINTYGLSEGVGAVTFAPLEGDRRIPTVGTVRADLELGIFDESGARVVDRLGEIRLRGIPGRTLMLGYHNRPELTAETLRDGWLHTGDVGIVDADGYLTFVDRLKDVIKRAGENVSAMEVEEVLCAHPAVAEAGVVGRPDPIRDEEVVAFVVAAPGAELEVAELRAHCAERLARFKVPTEYVVLDRLPRSTIGKLEKKTLRAMLVDDA